MKKVILGAMGLAMLFASCKKEKVTADNGTTLFGTQKPLIVGVGSIRDTLVGEITVNTTVDDNTYLKGIVYVKPGVTLTVNAGVTIFGSNGPVTPNLTDLSQNKGTLVVEKGGVLNAIGSANSPIVWTSENADGSRSFGNWGGIVILGNAPIGAIVGGVCSGTNTFEAFNVAGFPNPSRNTYGGSSAGDNSGSIVYNRIEFGGGTVADPNREVNGLTLCGVGSGTTLDYIEVSNSGDDAFEFFGGTVNAKHLISFSNKDDDFDFDEGYKGKLQFLIGYRTTLADNSGSHLIEHDNNPSATVVCSPLRAQAWIANASLISEFPGTPTGGGFFDTSAILVRRNSTLIFANSIMKIADRYPRAIVTTPTTTPRVAQGLTVFPADSTFIGANAIDKAAFGASSDENGRIITSVLNLPLQGPGNTPITNIFNMGPGGVALTPFDSFFESTSDIGSIPSSGPSSGWIGGSWVSTDTD